jgi:hypothetical protein
MLNIGSSVSWPEAVEKLTGQRKIYSASFRK